MTAAARMAPAPLVKTVTVGLDAAAAFTLFTAGIARWWPLATHSIGEADAVGCAMECRAGGRLVERERDGSEHAWGTVQIWDPPRRLVFTWHPGRTAETAQEIDVRFAASGQGTSTVTLEHRGWEAFGETAQAMRGNYDRGWDFVLGERFVKAAAAKQD